MSDVIVAVERRDLAEAAGPIAAWLHERLPGAAKVEVQNLAYPFGAGRSHETILMDAVITEGGETRTEGFVVRIKPRKHLMYPVDLFEEQYRLMQAVRADGRVPVAKTWWYEADPSLLGAPFFVMEKLKGRVAVSVPPYAQQGWLREATPAQRRKVWENGVRQLATIQKIPRDTLGFLESPDGARDGLDQEWDRYVRFLDWISERRSWPLFEAAAARLKARWPKNQPAGLVWGDARLGNIMFDDNCEVVAVMDWEQPSLGGALHDLAWWLRLSDTMHAPAPGEPYLEGLGSREETIALWREITGIPTDDIEWYEDFTALKLGFLSVRMAESLGAPTPTEAWPEMPMFRELAQRLDIPWGG
jgi:aminoglycoside phosphotransferase (APT) family kinase protein